MVILDPMLATGNSCLLAIEKLIEIGVKVENINFFNIISCSEGIKRILDKYPIQIITCKIDESLNDDKYICPGLGDFGDRYFNTTDTI